MSAVILVEYFVTDLATLTFVMRADTPQPDVTLVPLGRAAIRELVSTAFGPDMRTTDPHDWQEPLRPLLEPVLRAADDDDQIWLVPHDALHYAPLHAVPVDGISLADRHPVCYSPSASVMKYCQTKRTGRRANALVLADSRPDAPLPHARHQAQQIDRLFDGDTGPRLGPAATGDAIRRRLGHHPPIDVLHLACHGNFDAAHPEQSAITLADGALTMADILELRLDADLVTLSCCETGVSKTRPGDELIGLTRAFIYAGTPSVLVSLWAVDDISTGMLMMAFYQRLRAGAGKAAALRTAQQTVRTATIADVRETCLQARQVADDTDDTATCRMLDRDLADLHFRAGDFAAALTGYDELAATATEPQQRGLAADAARARRAMCGTAQPDYTITPFAHPYHWAPFVLVGDWR